MEKMKIFISWSGSRSFAVAEALEKNLRFINNAFDPWLSANMPKGSRSRDQITRALATATAGIICLTPSNLNERWILYEAGAISKTVQKETLACTLLIDLKPSDVSQPLGDFQHTFLTKESLFEMIKTLNEAAEESAQKETQLSEAFEICWPRLKAKLDNLPSDGPANPPQRTTTDLLAEVLDTVRRTGQDTASLKQAEQGNARGLAEVLAKLNTIFPTVNSSIFYGDPVTGAGQVTLRGLTASGSGSASVFKDLHTTVADQPTGPQAPSQLYRLVPPTSDSPKTTSMSALYGLVPEPIQSEPKGRTPRFQRRKRLHKDPPKEG